MMKNVFPEGNKPGLQESNPFQQSFLVQETSAFLKKEIQHIIKDELKTFGLRNKLEAQMADHNQKEANKQLSKHIFEDKMNTYKEKQKSLRRRQYDQFLKKQRDRKEKLNKFMKVKQEVHQQVFAQINHILHNVKQKHRNILNEDSSSRLTRLGVLTSQGNRSHISLIASISRPTSTSQHHRDIIKKLSEENETHLVSNYLNKIERVESKVLNKELEYEKRMESSKKEKVRCLVQERNKKEVQMMHKMEQQYNGRMERFQMNCSKTRHAKQSLLLNRSMASQNNLKMAAKRREVMHQKENTQKQTRPIAEKENSLPRYRSHLDLIYSQRNMNLNFEKMRREANQAKLENSMKLLTEKLQKIKNLKYGQRLDERSLQFVLSMLDRSDPEYASIIEFLQSERRAFLQGRVRKEEQRIKMQRMKKINKSLSKTLNKAGPL